MNRLIREVLKEVILYLLITKSNRFRGKRRRRRTMMIRFLDKTDFLGAMIRRLNEREREREREEEEKEEEEEERHKVTIEGKA